MEASLARPKTVMLFNSYGDKVERPMPPLLTTRPEVPTIYVDANDAKFWVEFYFPFYVQPALPVNVWALRSVFADYQAIIKDFEDWCGAQFGPGAWTGHRDRIYAEFQPTRRWVTVDLGVRFKDEGEAALFKLFWG